jgi:hypothetical protein
MEAPMKIQQLSLFIENKAGSLNTVCKTLTENKINLRALSLADTEQFGILRLIVKDWEQAKNLLETAGFVVNVTEVFALKVDDRPGGLGEVLNILDQAEINIEYMYAFTYGAQDQAIIVFRFENPDAAVDTLEKHNINIAQGIDFFGV